MNEKMQAMDDDMRGDLMREVGRLRTALEELAKYADAEWVRNRARRALIRAEPL